MSSPLVSVIIPCFNGQEYVGEAIQSALDQTYANKEIIVVDDGSTDGSLAVIQSFGEKIRWVTGPNRGGAAARNRCLELAQGALIQFLDADDVLDPRKLEEQVPVSERNPSDIVYSDWLQYNVGAESRKWVGSVSDMSGDAVILALAIQNITIEAPIHWKAALTAINGFREDLPCCQERDLHLRLACQGARFCHLPKALFTVRHRGGSISDDALKVVAYRRGILWGAYNRLRERGELTEARQRAFAALMAFQGRAVLRYGGDRRKAAEQFADARRMHSGGGLRGAYGPLGRFLVHVLGHASTETILRHIRQMKAALKAVLRNAR